MVHNRVLTTLKNVQNNGNFGVAWGNRKVLTAEDEHRLVAAGHRHEEKKA